jgi:hypothetical protein
MNPRRGCRSLAGGRGKRRRQSAAPPKWPAASHNPSPAVEIAMPMRNPAPRPSGAPRAREAPLRLFVLNHFQPHAMSLRFRSWPLSGISLVHVCQFHRLVRGLLHSLGQLAHVLSLLLVGCCHMQGEQVSQCVHRRVYLRTLLALRPVVAAPRAALSGVDCRVRESSMVGVGSSALPSERRNSTRKSWTISSNTPACSHRCVC